MKDIHPPIAERKTEELIEMIETSDRWRDDVLKAASRELELRGVSFEDQTRRHKRRKQRETNYRRRTNKIKANATYSTTEKVLIILFGPFLLALWEDFTIFDSGEGYKRKNRQGRLYLILGIVFWSLITFISIKLS